MPGSPFFHACSTILPNTSFALYLSTTSLVLGFIISYSSSFSTALINVSVTPTEILKLVNFSLLSFDVIKSKISGWSTLSIPIFAPLLVPPCFIVSVAALKTVIKDMGPLETPLVERTTSFRGLILENEYPTPPPDFWISAVSFSASKISFIESPTGRTKQAANC